MAQSKDISIELRDWQMLLKRLFKNLFSISPEKAFYAVVKCSDCGEEVKIRINRSADFQTEYDVNNPAHCYTVKKEIIGKGCFGLMKLTIALRKDIKVLSVDTRNCKFIRFGRDSI